MMTCRIILLFIAFPLLLTAQQRGQFSSKEYLAFTGEVKVLHVFVETPEGSWADDEMEYTLREYTAAQEWLIGEADYYGRNLSFDEHQFSRNNGSVIYLETTPRIGSSSTQTMATVMKKLNYRDLDDFMDYNQVEMLRDKVKVLLFVKSNNRSHAYNYWSMSDVDLAIVYCRHTIGVLTDRYVIAHEILHQFGAWDLYMGRSQTTATAEKAKERWPHSVMINTYRQKDQLVVDELTAWRVGWADYDPSFAEFSPVKNKEAKKKEIRIDPNKTVIRIKLSDPEMQEQRRKVQAERKEAQEERRKARLEREKARKEKAGRGE